MNIFATDSNYSVCARALDDVRLNKMILETCQLFAYALANNGCPQDKLPKRKDRTTPYKTGGPHRNHPCTLWAGSSKGNYRWLFHYFIALNTEREKRGFNIHACKMNTKDIRDGIVFIPDGGLTKFVNCSHYPDPGNNVHAAYKITMGEKWENDCNDIKKRNPKWTNTSPPDWYN